MASERHDDNDGSDIFWPGYVDATTNLILNLLFLLTILIVAVFMFALELGRSSQVKVEAPPSATASKEVKTVQVRKDTGVDSQAVDLAGENVALKNEIRRLNMLLAQRSSQDVQSAGAAKTVDAKFNMPKPLKGLDMTHAYESEIVVRFKDDAIAFTSAEREELFESLKPVAESANAGIYVEVPGGFSEAKRMGFYRAMAVRNILIEMQQPSENIDISVVEASSDASASVVRVRAY